MLGTAGRNPGQAGGHRFRALSTFGVSAFDSLAMIIGSLHRFDHNQHMLQPVGVIFHSAGMGTTVEFDCPAGMICEYAMTFPSCA